MYIYIHINTHTYIIHTSKSNSFQPLIRLLEGYKVVIYIHVIRTSLSSSFQPLIRLLERYKVVNCDKPANPSRDAI
jgi:hypothetical protein